MQLTICNDYNHMSQVAANDVKEIMSHFKHPLFSPASGDSPAGLYAELVKMNQQQDIDLTQWFYAGLDEWMHMDGSNKGSCRYFLDEQLFKPASIPAAHIAFFNGKATDAEAECKRIDEFINLHKPIQISILGLGMNGHVGMNEPGTDASLTAHVSQLDPLTAQVGQKYFTEPTSLSTGLTLGIKNLMEAEHIFLVVSGTKKSEILKKIVESEPSNELPATLLKAHQGLRIYCDKEAATLL